MADVKWIKITTDIFDDEKILLIESLPEADAIIVIWFKLLCLAGKQNNSGVFVMGDRIAYTDKMLATIFRRKEATVQLALSTFEQFGMIEIIDGVITIPNWEKHQNIDGMNKIREQTRTRVANYRERQKALIDSNVTDAVTVTRSNGTDKDKDKDKDKEKELYIYCANSDAFAQFWDAYPKKKDKARAEKIFHKLKPDEKLLEKMLSAIETQKKSKQWSEEQYIPYPSSWLNGKRWEDEVTPAQTDDWRARLLVQLKEREQNDNPGNE